MFDSSEGSGKTVQATVLSVFTPRLRDKYQNLMYMPECKTLVQLNLPYSNYLGHMHLSFQV